MKSRLYLFLFLLLLQGCMIIDTHLYFDYGKNWKNNPIKVYARYCALKERQFTIEGDVYNDEIQFGGVSRHNAPKYIQDSITKITFNKFIPILTETGDTLLEYKRVKFSQKYYSCTNFKNVIRKNKHLTLILEYTGDSLGKLTQYKKEYQLVKKRLVRFGLH